MEFKTHFKSMKDQGIFYITIALFGLIGGIYSSSSASAKSLSSSLKVKTCYTEDFRDQKSVKDKVPASVAKTFVPTQSPLYVKEISEKRVVEAVTKVAPINRHLLTIFNRGPPYYLI